jgi:hypothetical protein
VTVVHHIAAGWSACLAVALPDPEPPLRIVESGRSAPKAQVIKIIALDLTHHHSRQHRRAPLLAAMDGTPANFNRRAFQQCLVGRGWPIIAPCL